MLPGPGFPPLVIRECLDARDQQSSLAARTQPHVDLIEPPGRGVHGEQVNDALREPHEEQLVVDRPGAARLLVLAVRVVQEHEVEVRGITELHAAELAVADRTHVHRTHRLPLAAAGHAELRGDLPPAELHRALDDQLGNIGEPVAHVHERQQVGEVGHRDAEQGGALELPQSFDLLLGIVLAQLLRVGSCVSSRSSISSSSSNGCAAICAARKSPCRHSSTSRARAAPFSRSSAKYAERLPVASMMVSTRRSTGSCALLWATSASSAGRSACRRRRPASSSFRTSAEARSSSSSRAASPLSLNPARASASASAAVSAWLSQERPRSMRTAPASGSSRLEKTSRK